MDGRAPLFHPDEESDKSTDNCSLIVNSNYGGKNSTESSTNIVDF